MDTAINLIDFEFDCLSNSCFVDWLDIEEPLQYLLYSLTRELFLVKASFTKVFTYPFHSAAKLLVISKTGGATTPSIAKPAIFNYFQLRLLTLCVLDLMETFKHLFKP